MTKTDIAALSPQRKDDLERRDMMRRLILIASLPLMAAARGRHPDAALMSMCEEIAELEREFMVLSEAPQSPARVEAVERNDRRYQHLMAEAAKLPATTLEGLRARVSAVPHVVLDLHELANTADSPETAMVAALQRDLLQVGGRA